MNFIGVLAIIAACALIVLSCLIITGFVTTGNKGNSESVSIEYDNENNKIQIGLESDSQLSYDDLIAYILDNKATIISKEYVDDNGEIDLSYLPDGNYSVIVTEGGSTVLGKLGFEVTDSEYSDDFTINFDFDEISGELNLDIIGDLSLDDLNAIILNSNGNVIAMPEITDGSIDLSDLAEGDYSVIISDGAGNIVGNFDLTVGGNGDIDDSGKIQSGTVGGSSPKQVMTIYSDVSGAVYLRYKSFGDYYGQGWSEAEEYDGTLTDSYGVEAGLNYLTGTVLENSGYTAHEMIILNYSSQYFLPSYLQMNLEAYEYEVQTSDVVYSGDTSVTYKAMYYDYDYLTHSGFSETSYGYEELLYRNWVYDNYLAVPSSTYDYLENIIQEQGFASSDSDCIIKIAEYIKNSANYNLDYPRALDSEQDIVVSFLRDYKEGICQHYASAATLLYRAVGIPARYVIGYLGKTTAGVAVPVTSDKAHAWVEVYLDGIGWIQVDTTGSESENRQKLVLTAANKYAEYDANGDNVIYADPEAFVYDKKFGTLLEQGYTYSVGISGCQTGAGKSESVFDYFILYDPDGKDVTAEYEIDLKPGVLQIYYESLVLTSSSAEKIYDGTALVSHDYEITDGVLMDGHFIAVEFIKSRTKAGTTLNDFTVTVYDENGNDVTEFYKIIRNCGVLKITARALTVYAGSAEKAYDGTPIVVDTYTISGELANGDFFYDVTVEGYQLERGRSESTVTRVVILNSNGEDVTQNYAVTCEKGTLKVT